MIHLGCEERLSNLVAQCYFRRRRTYSNWRRRYERNCRKQQREATEARR